MAPKTKLPSSLALGQLRPRAAAAAAALPRAFSHAAAPIATATARPSASRARPAPLPPTLTPIRLAHAIPKPPAATSRTPRPKTNQDETEVVEEEEEEEEEEEGSAAGQKAKTKKRRPLGPNESPRPDMPAKNPQAYYQLSMTCVPCGHRSHHNISRQGYHRGSVLVACPGCKNRHVVSDHLGVFGDRKGVTVEDLLRDKGQIVRRGNLGEDGDVEFWPEDTER
ncbi:hypothetical protein N3K66_001317 [Trichothecium roseum]|uniref:Uncharacterized protein n=1 Tax=Trichothecium roseum TaxID=47278 RepID=A0ACC0VGA2_9HYPO|nr:hypothetical protein N3K66_001317 [Trichothecium roseum]